MCIAKPRCNQPNGKTHFIEKPGKNVVNTSKNGLSSNLFKITIPWVVIKKKIKLLHFQLISLGLQGSEPENETMGQLESHEILFSSGFKICKSF